MRPVPRAVLWAVAAVAAVAASFLVLYQQDFPAMPQIVQGHTGWVFLRGDGIMEPRPPRYGLLIAASAVLLVAAAVLRRHANARLLAVAGAAGLVTATWMVVASWRSLASQYPDEPGLPEVVVGPGLLVLIGATVLAVVTVVPKRTHRPHAEREPDDVVVIRRLDEDTP